MINENMSSFEQKRKTIYKNKLIKFKYEFDRRLFNIFTGEKAENIDEVVISLLKSHRYLFRDLPDDEASYFALAFIELYPEVVTILIDVKIIVDYMDTEKLSVLDLIYDFYSDLLDKVDFPAFTRQFLIQNNTLLQT